MELSSRNSPDWDSGAEDWLAIGKLHLGPYRNCNSKDEGELLIEAVLIVLRLYAASNAARGFAIVVVRTAEHG